MNLKELYQKYKDVIPYLFFGIMTTIANVVVYYVAAHIFGWSVMLSTIAAWFVAILLAYLTNRKWVFHSEAEGFQEILKEIVSFFFCRIATGIADWLCMFLFVDVLHLNDMVIKFLSNVLVVVLNYIASRLFIFRKTKKEA